VSAADEVVVTAQVSNAGGAASAGRSVRITLYTPADPAGRSHTQPVGNVQPGGQVNVSSTFDGCRGSQAVVCRLGGHPAGDGGREDQQRRGFLLQPLTESTTGAWAARRRPRPMPPDTYRQAVPGCRRLPIACRALLLIPCRWHSTHGECQHSSVVTALGIDPNRPRERKSQGMIEDTPPLGR